MIDGDHIYSPQRKVVVGRYATPTEKDPIVLNHYYSKSKRDAVTKLDRVFRGLDDLAAMKQARIDAIERSLVEDLRIQRFIPCLKQMQSSDRRATA
jgi:hypothetical protein